MRNERILTPATFALMTLLHVGIVAVAWKAAVPPPATVMQLEFVDLGSFGGGDGLPAGGEPAAAPETPKPQVQPERPKPQPKPAPQAKAVIKPVVTKQAQADIRQAPEKPKEVVKPVAKPVEKTVEKPRETAPVQTAAADAAPARGQADAAAKGSGGSGGDAARSGRGTGQGSGSGSKSGSGHGDGNNSSGSGSGGGAAKSVRASGALAPPSYPALSLENGEEGTVRVKISYTAGGTVSGVTVIKSSGFRRLDNAVVRAAKNGVYKSQGATEFIGTVSFVLPR